MGESKKQLMQVEERLIQLAFNEWEIEKMISEMTIDELNNLCDKIEKEKQRREKTNEN